MLKVNVRFDIDSLSCQVLGDIAIQLPSVSVGGPVAIVNLDAVIVGKALLKCRVANVAFLIEESTVFDHVDGLLALFVLW